LPKNLDKSELTTSDGNQSMHSWDRVYAEGRSLLVWPDEMFVRELNCLSRAQGLKGLDIGCGAGRHALLMADIGMQVKGIDSSGASVETARRRAAERGLNNVTFENISLQQLDEEDSSFDVIVIWGVVHYLSAKDQGPILAKIHQLLKPGGMLFATLRSTRDSRCDVSQRVAPNRYRTKYFDAGQDSEKEMVMSFWNEIEVRSLLSEYREVVLGHRDLEPISASRLSSCHWLIRAQK
jgi:cyclopropane fatty-acyl-phospholipid synthase-like methyltransferase